LVLWTGMGAIPSPLVDTQVACALLGQSLQMSYHSMVKWLTGVEVDKDLTRSNGSAGRSKQQLHYAATDVVFLPAIYRTGHELELLSRWNWLEEEVGRIRKKAANHLTALLRIRSSLD
jgi:ribonuclease D